MGNHEALNRFPPLSALRLRLAGNAFGPCGAAAFGVPLRDWSSLGSSLRALSLDLRTSAGLAGDDGLVGLTTALGAQVELRSLEVCLQTDFEGILRFSRALRQLRKLEALKADLSGSMFGTDGVMCLAEALASLLLPERESCTVEATDAEHNLPAGIGEGEGAVNHGASASGLSGGASPGDDGGIRDGGASASGRATNRPRAEEDAASGVVDGAVCAGKAPNRLAAYAGDRGSRLAQLQLDMGGVRIGDRGAKAVASALARGRASLVCVDMRLGACGIGESGGRLLSLGLRKLWRLTSLRLALAGNRVEVSGAVNVAKALAKMPCLTVLGLDLSGNAVGDTGVTALARSVANLTGLSVLEFNAGTNNLEEACGGVPSLARALLCLPLLRHLEINLRGNTIGDSAAACLAQALMSRKSLARAKLGLSNNCIGHGGAMALACVAKALTAASVTVSLDLRFFNDAEGLLSGATSLAETLASL
eukprot:TRINITY_DN17357_c0_g1_i2.p1 TRINITY_DN17357_c0_g1~~TRINITY_DN17357_c0_g1_i2.p1  ORF type:complete len:479 (+),score=75.31 TRINITY_DN17357_c0_g1_i2:794-2230(+)